MRPPHHLQGTCLFSLERGEAGAPATQLSFINHAGRLHRCARAARHRHGRGPLPASLSLSLLRTRGSVLGGGGEPNPLACAALCAWCRPSYQRVGPSPGCVRDHGFDHFLLASLLGGRLYMESPRAMAVEAPISA
jgi:hypothetical protein